MHYSAISSYTHAAFGRGVPGYPAAPTGGGRASSAETADPVHGPIRVSRDLARAFVGDAERQSSAPETDPTLPAVTAPAGSFDRRAGAPSGAFLAQHLAQEVMDTEPGFDSHRAGTRAYLNSRESTVEFMAGGARFDIRI